MQMTSSIGVALIEAYQRWLSSKKGFRCAYGVLYGSGTCSSIGKQIMREGGLFPFLRLMPEQFAACKLAAANLSTESEEEKRRREQKREWKREERCKLLGEFCADCGDYDLPFDCAPEMECGDCSLGGAD